MKLKHETDMLLNGMQQWLNKDRTCTEEPTCATLPARVHVTQYGKDRLKFRFCSRRGDGFYKCGSRKSTVLRAETQGEYQSYSVFRGPLLPFLFLSSGASFPAENASRLKCIFPSLCFLNYISVCFHAAWKWLCICTVTTQVYRSALVYTPNNVPNTLK